MEKNPGRIILVSAWYIKSLGVLSSCPYKTKLSQLQIIACHGPVRELALPGKPCDIWRVRGICHHASAQTCFRGAEGAGA